VAATEYRGALLPGFIDPGLNAVDFTWQDQRPDFGSLVQRITYYQLVGFGG